MNFCHYYVDPTGDTGYNDHDKPTSFGEKMARADGGDSRQRELQRTPREI